ncbi:hypothetical protein LCGC14_0643580 [marine sediment metagenome]|uniref:Uncharacterized protein n=1 Tax=marine sediment metagenome TaxID=412755 RepID=A0A0F9RI22_9ZZZZ
MGRMVQAPFNSVTIGADATQDLWSLMAAATNKLILHGWEISSDAIAATLLEVTLLRLSAVGSGGAAVTEVKLDTDDGAITGSVRVGDTTPGTPGDILAGYQWEQLGPLGMIYTPEMRPVIEVSTGIALVCNTAAAFEMSGWVCWEEI